MCCNTVQFFLVVSWMVCGHHNSLLGSTIFLHLQQAEYVLFLTCITRAMVPETHPLPTSCFAFSESLEKIIFDRPPRQGSSPSNAAPTKIACHFSARNQGSFYAWWHDFTDRSCHSRWSIASYLLVPIYCSLVVSVLVSNSAWEPKKPSSWSRDSAHCYLSWLLISQFESEVYDNSLSFSIPVVKIWKKLSRLTNHYMSISRSVCRFFPVSYIDEFSILLHFVAEFVFGLTCVKVGRVQYVGHVDVRFIFMYTSASTKKSVNRTRNLVNTPMP